MAAGWSLDHWRLLCCLPRHPVCALGGSHWPRQVQLSPAAVPHGWSGNKLSLPWWPGILAKLFATRSHDIFCLHCHWQLPLHCHWQSSHGPSSLVQWMPKTSSFHLLLVLSSTLHTARLSYASFQKKRVLPGCLLGVPGCFLDAPWVSPGCLLCASR